MKNVFMKDIQISQQLPLKLEAVGENENQAKVDRPDGYPAYHCMLCSTGNGYLHVDGNEYYIEPNSFFLLKPNQRHKYYPDKKWHTHWIVFNGCQAKQILSGLNLHNSTPKKLLNSGTIFSCYNSIYNKALNSSRKSIFETSSMLYSLLTDLSYSSVYGSEAESSYTQYTDIFLQYIEKNWQKNVGLNEMAFAINITPQYLCKICSKKLGATPYDYLVSYRLQKAKEIMMDNQLTVKDISKLSGFNDSSYFCAVFKKHEGTTPSKFRAAFYTGKKN